MRAAPRAFTTAVSRSVIGWAPRVDEVRMAVMAVAPVATGPASVAAAAPYAERRAELMRRLGPDAALVLASPPEQLRNGDTHFKFRQDSDILYLTGFEEPGAVVVLRPGHQT